MGAPSERIFRVDHHHPTRRPACPEIATFPPANLLLPFAASPERSSMLSRMDTTDTRQLDPLFQSMLRRRRLAARVIAALGVLVGVLVAGAGTAIAIDQLSNPYGLEGY